MKRTCKVYENDEMVECERREHDDPLEEECLQVLEDNMAEEAVEEAKRYLEDVC